MRSFVTYAFVITLLSCFLTIIAVPTLVGAQNQSESSNIANVTGPHKLGVKITSPSKNATVPAGQLTISGISSDTAITNCMVSADELTSKITCYDDPGNITKKNYGVNRTGS